MKWFLLVIAFVLPAPDLASAEQVPLLIDPATFVELPSDSVSESERRSATPVRALGPKIRLRRPDDNSVFRSNQRIAVHLIFLPADDGTMPDMESLDVRVRKGWLGKNITEVVAPYIEGTDLHIPEVDFSGYTGRFEFRVSISDRLGRTSRASFRVTVRATG